MLRQSSSAYAITRLIRVRQDHAPINGCDAGAPYNPNIKHKLLIVTLIITILFDMYVAMMLCTLRTGQHIST